VPDGFARSPILAELVDLNEDAMLVRSPRSLPVGASARITVAIEIAGGGSGPRIRHASCTVVVRQRRRERGGHGLILEYLPASARSLYVLHQYFLRNALACPRAPLARGRRCASAELLRKCSLQPAAGRRANRARVSVAR
jgi:hypothetical protein